MYLLGIADGFVLLLFVCIYLCKSQAAYLRMYIHTLLAEEMKRSPEDVMLRFDFRIRKQNKAGSWTKAEDAQLLNLFNKFGPKWAVVG